MARQVTIRSSLIVSNTGGGTSIYQSALNGFTASMAGVAGPTPGTTLCATGGTTISLAQLIALGGWCEIVNLDSTNYVTVGILASAVFVPFCDILPGEKAGPFRLASTILGGGNALRIAANTAACQVLIVAFDK